MKPPIAKRIPHPHELHGDVREDDYYWLKDRTNPDVIEYVENENTYYSEVMKPLEEQTEEIYQAMIDRVPDSEVDVPVQHGPYFYYSRQDKEKQYPIYVRKKAENRNQLSDAPEEVILDLNELAKTSDYLSVTALKRTTDHKHLAYLENRDGTDRYSVYVKDLQQNTLLSDEIHDVFIYGSVEWSRSSEYIFYITVDENERPSRLMRRKLGTTKDQDELLYEEKDDQFTMYLNKSQSGKYIFVHSDSKTTSEVRFIDTDSPLSPPLLIDARRKDVEYDVEHWGDDLLILTNDGALNFQLLRAPIQNLQARENVVPYHEDRFLQEMFPFQDELYVGGRESGLTQIWKLKDGELEQIQWDESIYSVSVRSGQSYDTSEVLMDFESLLTPQTTYSFNPKTEEMTRLHVTPVTGEYDSSNYVQKHLWATADDGVQIPMTMHYKQGALNHGPAPTILYAYGSYGANSDPHFSSYRLPALDKGIVFVTAQVRGGSEMGYNWYLDGKMQQKRNTFTDFISAAKFLLKEGYTTKEKLAARGGSAGGLLAGAVANIAPELFNVIVPEVPFVDVVTTMLDTSIPLTTLEWDEWGDPRQSEAYFYMKSYSPYDNVEAKEYPHLYVTTGLNDPRVGYWEPVKWVARLRALKTDNNTIVMKTNMGAGHFGESGRFNQLKEVASLYAFVFDKIGTDAGANTQNSAQ